MGPSVRLAPLVDLKALWGRCYLCGMARLYLTDSARRPLVVSVEQAVGRGCPNKRADVLLVQFMLYVVDQTPGKNTWNMTRRAELIKINGRFDDLTGSYIELFQRQLQGKLHLAHDSRIDPLSGGVWYGARTGVFMTMAALNMTYMEALGDDAIAAMVKHPQFPSEIRTSIQVSL